MHIDTILFDLDGTVTDSLPLIRQTYITVFEEMGIPWGNDDVMKLIGLPLRQIGGMMAGAGMEEEFFETYQRHYQKCHDKLMVLFPGTLDFLHWLRSENYLLGVVTSKSRMGADLTLSLLHLADYFDVVMTVDDTPIHKPNPEPVLAALEKLGKVPDQAVYVGDSPFDITAGNRAGVTTVAVSWGMAPLEELQNHQPSFAINSWGELKSWLSKKA